MLRGAVRAIAALTWFASACSGATCALAQTEGIAPYLSLDGSVGLQSSNNVRQSNVQVDGDSYLTSYLRLALQGRTADGLAYYVYARTFNEFYNRVPLDSTLSTFGITLAKTFDVVDAGVNFDTKSYRDRLFGSQTLIAHDLSIYLTKSTLFDGGLSVVQSRLSVGNRWADRDEAEQFWIDAQIVWEKNLAENWSLVQISRIQIQWYRTALLGPVPRDIVPSGLLGLKYALTNDLNLTVAATVTARSSNVGARDFTQWAIGPTIDFGFRF